MNQTILEQLERIEGAKADILVAITNKDNSISIPEDVRLNDVADLISSISTGVDLPVLSAGDLVPNEENGTITILPGYETSEIVISITDIDPYAIRGEAVESIKARLELI